MLVGRGIWIAGCDAEESSSETSESRHEQQEDQEEDHVCEESVAMPRTSADEKHTRSNGSDEVDKAQHAHVYQEERESLGERRALERLSESFIGRGRVEFVDSIERLKCAAESEPESSEGAENN